MEPIWKALRDAGLDIDNPVKCQTYLGIAQRPITLDPKVLEQQTATYQSTFTHTLNSDARALAPADKSLVVSEYTTDSGTDQDDDASPSDTAFAFASAPNIWEQSFDDVWEGCLTAADMTQDTPWVKDSVQRYENTKRTALAPASAKGDPSRVATAQGSARLGMQFSLPKDLSQIRCYENEMFGFVQQCIDQCCQLTKTNEKDIHTIKHRLSMTTFSLPKTWWIKASCMMCAHALFSKYCGLPDEFDQIHIGLLTRLLARSTSGQWRATNAYTDLLAISDGPGITHCR